MKKTLLLLILASALTACGTDSSLERQRPARFDEHGFQSSPKRHVTDHSRYQYYSADSGSGNYLGVDEKGEPVYGRKRPGKLEYDEHLRLPERGKHVPRL